MNPSCNHNDLIAAGGCFSGGNLSKNQQIAMKIYFMAAQLAAVGGTNYLGALDTTLIADCACKAYAYTPEQFVTADLVVELNNANSAGAAVSSNIQTLMAAIACLQNATMVQLKAAELQLRCELGRAKSYPQ